MLKPLYRRALASFERSLGPVHPKAITCQNNYESPRRRIMRSITPTNQYRERQRAQFPEQAADGSHARCRSRY
jgi:hypothetical protein